MSRFSENKGRKIVIDTLDTCAISHTNGGRIFSYSQNINSDKVRVTGSLNIRSPRSDVSDQTLYLAGEFGLYGQIDIPSTSMSMYITEDGSFNYSTPFTAVLDTVSDLIIGGPIFVDQSDEVDIRLKTVYFI
jgi:hypothetical protein